MRRGVLLEYEVDVYFVALYNVIHTIVQIFYVVKFYGITCKNRSFLSVNISGSFIA